MPRGLGPVLRVSVLSRSTLFVVMPALAVVALSIVMALLWSRTRSPLPDATAVLLGPLVALAIWASAREALTHVEVGRDGVLSTRRGRRRFVPFFSIESIEDRGTSLRFALVGGSALVIRVVRQRVSGRSAHSCDLLLEGVRQELARRKAFTDPTIEVEPASRDEQAHLLMAHARHQLGDATRTPPSYRDPPPPPLVEELWRVIDDPDEDVRARGAAAVMVRHAPDARKRLRVRAEETASPELRRLLRIAIEDEAAPTIAHALDACAKSAR